MGSYRFAILLVLIAPALLLFRGGSTPASTTEGVSQGRPASAAPASAGALTLTGFAEAVDGDSLRLDGRLLRLEGLDAPEFRQTCRRAGAEVPCGREAARSLRLMLVKGPAHCTSAATDRYRRPLVRCRVDGIDINAELVRSGMAISYYGGYRAEEREARQAARGLWAGEFERPQDWRRRHRS